jgi:hypothetical protein
MKLIGDIIYVFFVIIIFTVIRRGVDVVKWTVFWIVLRRGSFTVFVSVVGVERFELAGSLTLEADTSSHMHRENFVNKQRWNFIGREGGCSPKGMSRRLWNGYSRWDILVGGHASEIG